MKQQRALRTYQQTLDAASQEFIQQGYARATMAGVMARTELTKGALYGHFRSKEAVAAALVAHGAEACAQVLAEAAAGADDAVAALLTAALTLSRRLRSDPRVRAALRLATEPAAEVPGGAALLASIHGFLLEHAGHARRAGRLPAEHTPATVADLLLAVLLGYEQLPGSTKPAESDADLDEAWRLLARALLLTGPD
ncbi:TetR/AcrR family transcriptional regulator [Kitasatospora sp. NBC_01287]|uniref:TetR/AcrR family transcriptional regulator n=1 Tax=Kitasatospora sp. NBC_01287 TaxID=2903573 RepID=UPI00225352E9|nr:TetR/AcrR family transcriptional regulator [Kitasatospora sp. NBC_01287]MCX4746059.1 TetR/AcrR family transcriptional regulator [Kitasatospora sp. NBC_01287]